MARFLSLVVISRTMTLIGASRAYVTSVYSCGAAPQALQGNIRLSYDSSKWFSVVYVFFLLLKYIMTHRFYYHTILIRKALLDVLLPFPRLRKPQTQTP